MVVERAYLRRVKPKSNLRKPARLSAPSTAAPATSSTTPIHFSVNVVIPPGVAGPLVDFFRAGTDSPFRSPDEVPPSRREFVLQSSDQLDLERDDSPPSLNYTLNTVYDVDSRGFAAAELVVKSLICSGKPKYRNFGSKGSANRTSRASRFRIYSAGPRDRRCSRYSHCYGESERTRLGQRIRPALNRRRREGRRRPFRFPKHSRTKSMTPFKPTRKASNRSGTPSTSSTLLALFVARSTLPTIKLLI